MARVKESLVVQQKKISAVEKRKAEKAQKKYAKQVQAEAEAEKSERKKKRLREIDEWRKESQKRGRDLDERPRKFSSTQKTKDKKWGFGGVKRGSKKTTDRRDKSLSDLRKERNFQRGARRVARRRFGELKNRVFKRGSGAAVPQNARCWWCKGANMTRRRGRKIGY